MSSLKPLIVIPARYASVRFPGKPLAQIGNKPMVQWVYENASKTGFPTVVATDDERIARAVNGFGGNVVMTSANHPSGTDRCLEAAQKFMAQSKTEFNIVVNVQGDEPFVDQKQIQALVDLFTDTNTDIATLVSAVDSEAGFNEISDVNKVKVVRALNGNALYFSRATIPYNRSHEHAEWIKNHTYYTHIGMYAYRFTVLKQITQLPPSALELTEKLEQLRWLENGFTIKTAITSYESIGVDTPEDLEKVKNLIEK